MSRIVNGTHVLFGNTSGVFYVVGRVMGYTPESTPRTIVYIENWPIVLLSRKSPAFINQRSGGVYYGRIVQGQFVSGSNFGYNFQLSSLNPAYLPRVDNCWITNNWEQTLAPGPIMACGWSVYMGIYSADFRNTPQSQWEFEFQQCVVSSLYVVSGSIGDVNPYDSKS